MVRNVRLVKLWYTHEFTDQISMKIENSRSNTYLKEGKWCDGLLHFLKI